MSPEIRAEVRADMDWQLMTKQTSDSYSYEHPEEARRNGCVKGALATAKLERASDLAARWLRTYSAFEEERRSAT